jgi:hypothetical protein
VKTEFPPDLFSGAANCAVDCAVKFRLNALCLQDSAADQWKITRENKGGQRQGNAGLAAGGCLKL